MGNPALTGHRAQSFLESSFMLVAAILLLLGIVRVSLWFNSEIAQRQSAYNATRLEAGSDTKGEWPVYARKNLTEAWVLGGQSFTNQSGGKTKGKGITSGSRGSQCGDNGADGTEVKENIGDAQDKEDQADELNAEADILEKEAEALDIQAAGYQTQYDSCITNYNIYEVYCSSYCEAIVADDEYNTSSYLYQQCGTCCDYLRQAEECRQKAEKKRGRAEAKREEAESLQKEATNIMLGANDLNEECMKDRKTK